MLGNKFVFEGHSSLENMLSSAIGLAREWSTEVKKKESLPRSIKTPVETPMPPEALVVKSDAAWSIQHEAGGLFGVNWVGSVLIVEGIATREAFRACAEMRLKMVKFESECSQLIKALNAGPPVRELYGAIADILSWQLGLSLERNSVADKLAKYALIVSETLVAGVAVNALN
ncbi:hypothetical protein HID58_014560 [Brassica napus]|uniref:RNase H type-1 domain-containing protein n=1 Tax=Brassica napus TaxID=3708 RepID=A0ABQ8DHZ9_BRANA|nr:hypothetical protein HID58_014560 [Brassica napus]